MDYPLGIVRPRHLVVFPTLVGAVVGVALGWLHSVSRNTVSNANVPVVFAAFLGGAGLVVGTIAARRQLRVLRIVESWLGKSLKSGDELVSVSVDRMHRVRSFPFHRAPLSISIRNLADRGGGSKLVLEEIDSGPTPVRLISQTIVDGALCVPSKRQYVEVKPIETIRKAPLESIRYVHVSVLGEVVSVLDVRQFLCSIVVDQYAVSVFSLGKGDLWTDIVDG